MTTTSPRRRSTSTRGAAVATLLVALLLLVGACGTSISSEAGSDPVAGRPASPAASPAATTSPAGSAGSVGSSEPSESARSAGSTAARTARFVPGPTTVARTAPRALRPVRITIPAIGVDAATTDLGIGAGGAIEVPTDPDDAGWLDTTPAPGQQGPTVVAGHVDSTEGPAVFYRLRELSPGDAITLTRRDGRSVTYTVDGVRTYAKRSFPTRDVYGPAPGPVLRLITCGGDYVRDRGGYLDNVVVYAS